MRLNVAHASLQWGDTSRQHTEDIEKLFDRAVRKDWAWITGTESGPGSGNVGEELIRIARQNGFKPWVPEIQQPKPMPGHNSDCWIAVNRDFIDGDWDRGFVPVIPSSAELYKANGFDPDLRPRWAPKGIAYVSWRNNLLGNISVGASHYLTGSRNPNAGPVRGVDHWDWNQKLGLAIGEWADAQAQDRNLAFYGGDQNMADDKNDEPQGDTFFGEGLTSAWDEVGRWENTGHGCIDVIASYDKDRRVTAVRAVALDDKEFSLHGDHFLIEASYEVEELKHPLG